MDPLFQKADMIARLFLFASLLTVTFVAPASSQNTDDRAWDPTSPEIYVGTDLAGLYSATYGFGFDGVVGLRNVPLPGSSIRLHAWPSWFRQVVFATFSLTDATESPFILTGYGLREWNNKDRTYLNLHSEEDQWTLFDRYSWEAEVKAGLQCLPAGLSLLPFFRYEHHHLFDSRLGPVLDEILGDADLPRPATVSGTFLGADFELDLTDNRVSPTRGIVIQARFEHFSPTTDRVEPPNDILAYCEQHYCVEKFQRGQAALFGYVPLGGRHVLALRVLGTNIWSGTNAVTAPYYLQEFIDYRLLPGFGRNRFRTHRHLVGTVEYRLPIGRVLDLYRFEALLHTGFAVMEDVFSDRREEFGFAVGMRAASLANDRVLFHWLIGFSGEGVTFVPFRLVFQPNPRVSYPHLR